MPAKPKSKLAAFIKKHKRGLLTFVGSLIVFITFVVKEGKRDELKDIVGAISSAQTAFAVREDTLFVQGEIQEVQRRVDAISNEINQAKPPKLRDFDYEAVALVSEVKNIQANSNSVLRHTYNLFEELPEQPATVRDELEGLKSRWGNLDRDFKRLRETEEHRAMDQWQQDLRKNKNAILKPTDEFSSALLPMLQTGNKLWEDITKERDSVFHGARLERARSEASYRTYSRCSFFLYAFGWFLGLVGKFWGVSEENGSE